MPRDERQDAPPEECHARCEERLEEILGVLAAHARILEAHETAQAEVGKALREVRAELQGVRAAQGQANQLLAQIHRMWADLECVKDPRPRRPPSTELRAVGDEEEETG